MAPGFDVTTPTPVHIYKQQAGGGYADTSSSTFNNQIPGQIHRRKVILSDFNGDGGHLLRLTTPHSQAHKTY